jgi:hypothetical protein
LAGWGTHGRAFGLVAVVEPAIPATVREPVLVLVVLDGLAGAVTTHDALRRR